MSRVFVAEEIALGRRVVVKVLPPEMGAGVNAERFRREIQLAASLQHPHIMPLLSAGHSDDLVWYTMPLVEGESLRTRLAREGELPVTEAVRLLRDVADALAYAHQHGVVHRDIKPDNVLISGQHAVVTDFGVSKAITAATGEASLTSIGIALGTPAYMAPEQAAAEPHVDHRADLYALGAMAYEMLTGAPPFRGEAQVVLAAHVTRAPEAVTARRPAVPAALGVLVMRCLEKKPADRWQSAAELHQQLEAMATPSGGMAPTGAVSATAGPTASRRRQLAVLAGVGAGVVGLAALVWVGWRAVRPGEPAWELSNYRQVTHEPQIELMPAISPDGREVAYAAGNGGDMHVYVRDITGGRALSLTADRAGAQTFPLWSSDGRRIVFCQSGGGAPQGGFAVPRMGGAATPVGRGCVRGQRGDSLVYQRGDSLFVGSVDGVREALVVTAPALHSASWSPDGGRLAYVRGNRDFVREGIWANPAPSSLWTIGVRGGVPVPVADTESRALHESPVWLPDGRHLLYVSNRDGARDLYLVALGRSGRPRGPAQRLTTGLDVHTLSVAADGRTVAYSHLTYQRNLFRLPVRGLRTVSIRDASPVTTGNQDVESSDISRDGRWLAFDSDLEGNSDIYVIPASGGEPRRLTRDPGQDFGPSFSPDGREIAFYSTRFGTRDVFLINADGTGETRLTHDAGEEYYPKFSPDGLSIAFTLLHGGRSDVFLIHRDSVGGTWGAPQQLTRAGDAAFPVQWSPDGGRVVFSRPSGISVASLSGEQRTAVDFAREHLYLASGGGGAIPRWSADGRALWFLAADSSGRSGIFEEPVTGGRPRMMVRFDEPARAVLASGITLGGGSIYLSISEYQSDVYVADLRRR